MLVSRERKSTILEEAALHGNCHHLSKHEQRNPTPAVYGWTTGWGSQSNHLLWGASTTSNGSWNKKHHQDKSKGDHSGFVNGKVKFDGYFITAFVLKKEQFFITFMNVSKKMDISYIWQPFLLSKRTLVHYSLGSWEHSFRLSCDFAAPQSSKREQLRRRRLGSLQSRLQREDIYISGCTYLCPKCSDIIWPEPCTYIYIFCSW